MDFEIVNFNGENGVDNNLNSKQKKFFEIVKLSLKNTIQSFF